MSVQTKFVNELPEWFKLAQPNSGVSAREVAALLGLNIFTFEDRCKRGLFPVPDFRTGNYFGARKRFWRVSTIKKVVAWQELSMVSNG